MIVTLTYRGPLPPKQRGVSPIKTALRTAFHPQIRDQVAKRIPTRRLPQLTTTIGGFEFISPAHASFQTAVELDVLLLTKRMVRPGDVDNRLKTLIDGLTRPANEQQMDGHAPPADGSATYCLLDDDRLVQSVRLDSRAWHEDGPLDESLVIVSAKLVLSNEADVNSPVSNLFLVA